MECLLHFKSVPEPGPSNHLAATIAQLGMLQSSSLAGDVSVVSAPGATWTTPAGKLLPVQEGMAEPKESEAKGITWVDAVATRQLHEGVVLVSYQLWSFNKDKRDSSRVRMCSAVLLQNSGAGDGFNLAHLHESYMDPRATATQAFVDLATGQQAYEGHVGHATAAVAAPAGSQL